MQVAKSMIWRVEFLDSAKKDLEEIYDYIAYESEELAIAEKQTGRILDAAFSLQHMPFRHQLCSYEPWCFMGLRVMPVGRFLMFYIADKQLGLVNIVYIIHAKRDVENILRERDDFT